MIRSIEHNARPQPVVNTAVAGYWDTETVQQAIDSGAQVLVSPDGAPTRNGHRPRQMVNNLLAQRMRAQLSTETGRARDGMRKTIAVISGKEQQRDNLR